MKLIKILFVLSLLFTFSYSQTIEVRVSNSYDDAEEKFSNGSMHLNSSDLELTEDSNNQIVGIRFQNLNIPKNATITNAYIQFEVDETSSTYTSLTIEGEDTDNFSAFSSSDYDISSRDRTGGVIGIFGGSVSWHPSAWNNEDDHGADQRTPNLKNIVQKIIDRDGWTNGNSMSFIISGLGKRVAKSYDVEHATAPLLHIEYSGGDSSDDATCYALTDNSDRLYTVTMHPNATPLPIASYVNISTSFNGEGSAYRASDNKFYAFKGVSDDEGPSDLYSIDVETGEIRLEKEEIISDIVGGVFGFGGTDEGTVEGAEFYFDPSLNREILYVISREENSKLYAFDPNNNWALLSGYPKDTNTDLSSLAINPINGVAYAIDDYNYHVEKPKVYQLNLKTGATTHITTLQNLADAEGLAFASDGNLYIEDEGSYDDNLNEQKLYKVSLQTGELTPSAITNSNGDIEGLSCNGTQIAIDNPTVSIDSNSSVVEGDSNTTDLIFAINLSKPAVEDILLHYEITDINTTVNEDYILDSNLTILIPKDANSSSIVVKVIGDTDVESDESFSLKLLDATNAIVDSSSIIGTIINDDGVLQEPFTCNETLYLSNRTELGTGSGDSGATWLHRFNAMGTNYASIGTGFTSSDGGYNAIGYNVHDNFIYALYSNHLLKIDANAVVKDLGAVQGLPAEQLYAGEFDRDGFYYVAGDGNVTDKMYKIDIEQKKVIATITLSPSVLFWDMAIDTTGEYFYTMLIQDVNGSYKNDKFAKIKISDGTITPIGSLHSDLPSYISLIFTDAEGKIIALSQDGKLYEIMPQSGKVYFTKPFASLSFYNDGTSCPDANITLPPHPPRLSINNVSQLEGDSGETTFNFTVTADKPFDMMPVSVAMFKYRVVDANGTEFLPDEVAIGGNMCDDNSDTDFKKEEYIEMNISMFGDGVSINLPVTICGDEKVEKDEKFFVEIYSPTFSPLFTIDKNIGIGTIINDDNIFNIERVNRNEESNQTLKESLYTQISGKDFDYSIVSYFGPDTNVEYDVQNVLFKIELLDSTDENKTTLYTKYYHANELKKRFPIEDSDDLKIQRATRDARFKIFYILDVNNTTISEFNNLQDAYENLENNSSFKKGINFSRDNFSIRPAGFKEMLWADDGITRDHLATSNQKESYGIALAAGYEYELQVKALSDNGDVLESYEVQNATQEVNATLVFDGNKTKCADITNRELHYYNFIGGVNSNKEFKNSNVGNYYITIKDENWTNIDHINQGCIVDSDSNEPDENGTIGCNIGSTFDIHSVDPTYNHYYDLKVYFQPYIFDIDLSIKNFSNSGHNYLYMADLNSSNKMSIVIDGNVTAMSKDNKIATNFTKSCLAQKVNLSLDYRITADSGVYDNNLTQLRTINNTPIVIQRRIKHNSKKFLDVEESAIFDNNITLSIEDFDDNLTGHSHLELLYNIKKNLNEEINPVEINFLKAHVISKDAGSNLATNEIEDFFPTGVENLGISRTLYYSRVSSLAKHYPATNKKSIYTPLFMEVYCRTNTTTQDWCREIMNLNDNGMINNGQKTYRGWYLATQHDSATEGRVLELQNITNNSDKITTNYTTSIPPFHNGKIDIQTIYVDGALTEKVSATIEIGTDPWLVFNEENSDKNASYSVTMKPIAGMTGVSPNKDTELGYNLMRDRNGTLNGIVEYNGKMSW